MGVALLRKKSAPIAVEPSRFVEAAPRPLGLVALTGAVGGLVIGVVGGGNIFVAQALHRIVGVPFRRALAMALALGLVAAILGATPYVLAHRVDLAAAPAVILPALLSARLTGALATRVEPRRIQQAQGVYVLAMALVIAARAVS
jgi:uncharacterized membrane protein YfcA